jgi:hypothetical protein
MAADSCSSLAEPAGAQLSVRSSNSMSIGAQKFQNSSTRCWVVQICGAHQALEVDYEAPEVYRSTLVGIQPFEHPGPDPPLVKVHRQIMTASRFQVDRRRTEGRVGLDESSELGHTGGGDGQQVLDRSPQGGGHLPGLARGVAVASP